MTDRQETVADIIAEMKREAAKIFPALPIAVLQLATRLEAACLEAAHRREREMTKPAGIVNSGAASDTAGNCAKLREALVKCQGIALQWQADEIMGVAGGIEKPESRSASEALIDIEFVANAALAAPPRNCDKYATADEALKAQEQMFNDSNFANGECKLGCPECDNPRIGCKIAWLFAPATETEGGAK